MSKAIDIEGLRHLSRVPITLTATALSKLKNFRPA